MLQAAANFIIPAWAKWLAIGLLMVAVGGAGYVQGRQDESKIHLAYVAAQTQQTVRIVEQQVKVVTKVETVYRDRVQKIYLEGKTIETLVPTYIQPADDDLFRVPVGLVRVVDAAWTGQALGPANDADREPSGIPISELARTQVENITSCHLWRNQALGWRQFYDEQQRAINGSPGDWYRPQ